MFTISSLDILDSSPVSIKRTFYFKKIKEYCYGIDLPINNFYIQKTDGVQLIWFHMNTFDKLLYCIKLENNCAFVLCITVKG